MTPPIVHLMHFPWDAQQRLKADPHDFDRRYVDAMRAYAPDFEVRMWTFPEARALCESEYPDVWTVLQHAARPVMLVDVLRWVVVHRFGGIYWQMNTTPLVPMPAFLPPEGFSVRLFTEFDLSPEECLRAAAEPIRGGEPEESKRILIQVFSAAPGAGFVERVIEFLVERVRRHAPRRDYDILFITGNAAVSTAYDRFGKSDAQVSVTERETARRMMKWHYRGSWRVDDGPARAVVSAPSLPAPRKVNSVRSWIDRCRRDRRAPPARPMDAATRTTLRAWMDRNGLTTLWERPADRPVTASIPRSDVVVAFDELERRSDVEAARLLAAVARSPARYFACTHHPLVCDWWSANTGDYRPINFSRPPFEFPQPLAQFPCADPARRPDRVLAVWPVDVLNGFFSTAEGRRQGGTV